MFFFFKNLSETVGPWRGQKQKLMAPQKLDMSGSKFPWAFSWTVFFSGAMFGSIRSENETEVPGTFLGNQNPWKRIGTKWKEQQSTFWTIENLNQLSIFSNFQKLLSCSAVFANLPEILAVCAQKMGPQSLKIFIFGLPSFAECPQFIFGAAIFGRIPR